MIENVIKKYSTSKTEIQSSVKVLEFGTWTIFYRIVVYKKYFIFLNFIIKVLFLIISYTGTWTQDAVQYYIL